jgi:hypothetical protein
MPLGRRSLSGYSRPGMKTGDQCQLDNLAQDCRVHTAEGIRGNTGSSTGPFLWGLVGGRQLARGLRGGD